MNEFDIAREFCQYINWWLSAEDLAEAVKRNKEEPNPNICHSHDFCDPNEAMIEAFKVFNLDPLDNLDLCNKAWDLAKSAEFDPDRVGK